MNLTKLISPNVLGKFSEYLVAAFLITRFYNVLCIRYKSYTGEVDIIATRGNVLIFVEVKSRKKLDLSYNIIRNRQIARIKRTAEFYLQKNNKFNNYSVRFDLMIVSNFFHIEHIKNAW